MNKILSEKYPTSPYRKPALARKSEKNRFVYDKPELKASDTEEIKRQDLLDITLELPSKINNDAFKSDISDVSESHTNKENHRCLDNINPEIIREDGYSSDTNHRLSDSEFRRYLHGSYEASETKNKKIDFGSKNSRQSEEQIVTNSATPPTRKRKSDIWENFELSAKPQHQSKGSKTPERLEGNHSKSPNYKAQNHCHHKTPDRLEGHRISEKEITPILRNFSTLNLTETSSPETKKIRSLPPKTSEFEIIFENISTKVESEALFPKKQFNIFNTTLSKTFRDVTEKIREAYPYLNRELRAPGKGISKFPEQLMIGSTEGTVAMESIIPIPITPINNHFEKLTGITFGLNNILDQIILLEKKILQSAIKQKKDHTIFTPDFEALLTMLKKMQEVNSKTLQKFLKNKTTQTLTSPIDTLKSILNPGEHIKKTRSFEFKHGMPESLETYAKHTNEDIITTGTKAKSIFDRFYPNIGSTEAICSNVNSYISKFEEQTSPKAKQMPQSSFI
ncbi:MAG: hypothetical protein VW397_00960 [Candidatus Margulisiibacteriota bacterium]